MKIRTLFVFVMFGFLSCQENYKNENPYQLIKVPIYEVVNSDLNSALDSFIVNESRYEYYDSLVVLYANTMNRDGTILQFSSGAKQIHFPVIEKFYADSTLGIFFHKTNLFVLYGRSVVSPKLMKKSNLLHSLLVINMIEDNSQMFEDDTYFPTTWIGMLVKDSFIINNKFEMKIESK